MQLSISEAEVWHTHELSPTTSNTSRNRVQQRFIPYILSADSELSSFLTLPQRRGMMQTTEQHIETTQTMGLLQNLAAVAIRNKVMANLRANCPEGIQNELETLLGNKEAVGIIQNFVTEAMKGGGKIQAEAVTTLPFPAEIRELLAATPKLVTYLVLAARMAGKK